MWIEETLSRFFRAEERRKGFDLDRRGLVVMSGASDSHVKALIKGSSACKVILSAPGVGSAMLNANCSCSRSRRGALCQHVWAVLLNLERKDHDFLQAKLEVVKAHSEPTKTVTKQNEYNRQRYQRLKNRAKEMRREKKQTGARPHFSYPRPVQEALKYFLDNGFQLDPPDLHSSMNAKKLLARVFHPDKGASHEEGLTLNRYYEIIRDYLKS